MPPLASQNPLLSPCLPARSWLTGVGSLETVDLSHWVPPGWFLSGPDRDIPMPLSTQVLASCLCSARQLMSPFLASPVPRPPPSTSGLTSVSFALFFSLTGIIKIRINRQVSISSLSSSSSCLVDWLCPGLSHRLWLAVSLFLSPPPSPLLALNTSHPFQQLARGCHG